MFKTCEKSVVLLRKTCGKLCEKLWVDFTNYLTVGKSTIFNTVLPTNFLQLFTTHPPQLKATLSPLSTPLTITTIYIIKKGK